MCWNDQPQNIIFADVDKQLRPSPSRREKQGTPALQDFYRKLPRATANTSCPLTAAAVIALWECCCANDKKTLELFVRERPHLSGPEEHTFRVLAPYSFGGMRGAGGSDSTCWKKHDQTQNILADVDKQLRPSRREKQGTALQEDYRKLPRRATANPCPLTAAAVT